jgi:hypothetical protein
MEIEKIIELFREYIQRNSLSPLSSFQIHKDGSGVLLNANDEHIRGTTFDNVDQLCDVLTGKKQLLKELQKAEEAYLTNLRRVYSQGTKITLEVRSQSVEVTVDKP